MLDMNLIRNNQELVIEGLKKREYSVDFTDLMHGMKSENPLFKKLRY